MGQSVADLQKEADLEVLKGAGKILTCCRLLVAEGLPLGAFQLPIDDPEMRKRLVRIWMNRCRETTTSQEVAKGIMGDNMVDFMEMLGCFEVAFSHDNCFSGISEIPFSDATLSACRDTHVLFPGFHFTIEDMLAGPRGNLFANDGNWYISRNFFLVPVVRPQWFLLRKGGIEVTAKLANEEPIFICEAVFAAILFARIRSIQLFPNQRAQCLSSTASPSVFVGQDEKGLHIHDHSVGTVLTALAVKHDK